jgi:multiple antibiotic resistance protein
VVFTFIEIFVNAFITLAVIIDPIGTAAVFCVMTAHYDQPRFRKTALRAAAIAFGLLLFFALFGSILLQKLGISLPAFRIAGGILLFVTAFRMLFGQPQPESIKDEKSSFDKNDIAVFPIAIPLLAGPGCMTAIILLMSRTHDATENIAVLAALVTVHVVALSCLLAASPIQKWLGDGGVNILARVMGVILAAMSVQFVVDGLRGMSVLTGG